MQNITGIFFSRLHILSYQAIRREKNMGKDIDDMIFGTTETVPSDR